MSRLARALFALGAGVIAACFAGLASAEPAPPVLWRFQAAAPISAAPAVSGSGNVYLASVEGVVHALAADGRLRWSHGVAGMPVGEPALDPRERVFLATSAGRLYSFHADGRLRWRRQARARVHSGAVWLQPGRVFYLGGEQSLYALSSAGDEASRVLAGATGLFTAPDITAAVAMGRRGPELWRWSGVQRARRLPLPPELAAQGLQQLLTAGEGLWLVAAGALHALPPAGSRAIRWSVPARWAAVSADGETLLVATDGELRWLDAQSGEARHRLPLPEAASAPPFVDDDGRALVPLVSGELLLASPGQPQLARVRVGAAPVLRPVWSEPAGAAAVAAGDGSLVLLQLGEPSQSPATAVAHSPEPRAR